MDGKLIWLASYPKSGNTWFRSFLTALEKGEVDINQISTNGIFSGKNYWEEILDTEFDDLRPIECQNFRKLAVRHLVEESRNRLFIKIHDAYSYATWDGQPLIPDIQGSRAIYLVRNPLDVVLSLANHNRQSVDQTIANFICKETAGFVKSNRAGAQSYQLLGTWSMHVESWMRQDRIPVKAIRYEDMKEKPNETFWEALKEVGVECSLDQVRDALSLVEFDKLRDQEARAGFKEKPYPSMRFFNHGKSGRWREELTLHQISQVMCANEKMMKYFGYWGEAKTFLIQQGAWQGPENFEPIENQSKSK